MAEHMVGSNLLNAARDTVAVFQEAETLCSDLLSEMKTTEELNWKVGIGIKLSEEEKSSLLIQENREYADVLIFEGGELLYIPGLEEESNGSMPPWRS